MGPWGWGAGSFFYQIFFFIFVRSPCKNLKPYNNPFWGFEQQQEIKKKWPPTFMPAAKGSACTPLGPILAYLSCSFPPMLEYFTSYLSTTALNTQTLHCAQILAISLYNEEYDEEEGGKYVDHGPLKKVPWKKQQFACLQLKTVYLWPFNTLITLTTCTTLYNNVCLVSVYLHYQSS